jgi:hypothetical protein
MLRMDTFFGRMLVEDRHKYHCSRDWFKLQVILVMSWDTVTLVFVPNL